MPSDEDLLEDEENGVRKRTKHKRRRKPNLREQPLYPSGTPLNGGLPEENVRIPRKLAEKIPLDAESAKMFSDHVDTMTRKGKGQTDVAWNSDMETRYLEVAQLKPAGTIKFQQTYPVTDDNINPQPIAALPTFYDAVRYLRDNHWDGREARYKWKVSEGRQVRWCTGEIVFREDPRRVAGVKEAPAMQNPSGPQYVWHPELNAYVATMPGPAAPVPQMMPPMMSPAPLPPPPAPAPAPAPVMMPQSNGGGDMMTQLVRDLMTQNAQLTAQLSAQTEYTRQLRDMIAQLQQQLTQKPVGTSTPMPVAPVAGSPYPWMPPPPPAPPEPPAPSAPVTPNEAIRESFGLLDNVLNMALTFKKKFSPPEEVAAATPETPPAGADDFKIPVKDLGPVRVMQQPDGTVTTAPWEMNVDKYKGLVSGLIGDVEGVLDRRAKKQAEVVTVQMQAMREATDLAERRARAAQVEAQAQRTIATSPAPSPMQAPATVQAPSRATVRLPTPMAMVQETPVPPTPVPPEPEPEPEPVPVPVPEPIQEGTRLKEESSAPSS